MQVVRSSAALAAPPEQAVLTIGNFDGLHRGHRAITEIVTDRAYGGDPWAVFMGAVVWILLIILVFPLRAGRNVWRDYRRQEIQSQKALTEIEERIFAADDRSSNVHSPQERLARRALSEIETKLLGEPQPADLTIEERIIKLRDG